MVYVGSVSGGNFSGGTEKDYSRQTGDTTQSCRELKLTLEKKQEEAKNREGYGSLSRPSMGGSFRSSYIDSEIERIKQQMKQQGCDDTSNPKSNQR